MSRGIQARSRWVRAWFGTQQRSAGQRPQIEHRHNRSSYVLGGGPQRCVLCIAAGHDYGIIPVCRAGGSSISTEDNIAVIQRIFAEVWNAGNLERIDDLFAPDFVRPLLPAGAPQGPAAEKSHRRAFQAAFPDLVISADDIVAEGDRVAVRYTWRATHQGALGTIPPTGRRVMVTGIAIHRLAAGRVQALWVVADELGLLQQLGVRPPLPWTTPAAQPPTGGRDEPV